MKHHRVISIEDLASGKVSFVGPSEQDDQYCTEHDGEEIKFFCRTCGKMVCRDCIIMKQRCRDHDYVTLKEESSERSSQLKELMNKCTETMQLYQESMKKAQKVKSELSESVAKARASLDNGEKEHIQQVKRMYSQVAKQVNQSYQENKDKLDKSVSDLTTKMQKLESTYQEGQNLMDTASHAMIISRYKSMHEILQEACQDEEVSDVDSIPMSVTSMCMNVGQRWKQCKKVKLDYSVDNPMGIALTSDKKMIIHFQRSVRGFSSSGNEGFSLFLLVRPGGNVAIDSKDRIITPIPFPEGQMICVYDKNFLCQQQCLFSDSSLCYAVAAVDINDRTIVGNSRKISVYNTDINSVTSGFNVHSQPMSIAASFPGEITIVYEDNTLQTVDYSGKIIRTFQPPPEVITWEPRCVCASKRCEVFVLNQGDPKAIYRYIASGEYLGCVTTEIVDSRGIAMSHDDQELYVTEYTDQLVKVFKRP